MASTLQAPRSIPPQGAPRARCYAHRGARGYLPENTLRAFSLAFDLGADGIECDVQRSKDGHLVIVHDGTVDRTTNGKGAVAALSFAELRALDAGRLWHVPQRIPTLEETLALVRERNGLLNLEIKAESTDEAIATASVVAPVLAALDDAFRSRILVSSFEHPALAHLKRRLPATRIATLHGGRQRRQADPVAVALELGAEAIHPAIGLISPALIAQAHAAGLCVTAWTANRPITIRRLLSWGIDGLIGDYPERLVIFRMRWQAREATFARG